MKYKTLILDLDGTLLDTLEDIADAMNYALSAKGLAKRTLTEFRAFVGRGMRDLLTRCLVPIVLEPGAFDSILNDFLDFYRNHQEKTCPYTGVIDLLLSVQDRFNLVVFTNKEQKSTEKVMENAFQGVNFTEVLGQKEGVPLKPNPAALSELLKKNSWKTEECLYIGDSEVDVRTAQNAGCDFWAVLWGFRDEAELREAGAQIFFSSTQDLKNSLKSI